MNPDVNSMELWYIFQESVFFQDRKLLSSAKASEISLFVDESECFGNPGPGASSGCRPFEQAGKLLEFRFGQPRSNWGNGCPILFELEMNGEGFWQTDVARTDGTPNISEPAFWKVICWKMEPWVGSDPKLFALDASTDWWKFGKKLLSLAVKSGWFRFKMLSLNASEAQSTVTALVWNGRDLIAKLFANGSVGGLSIDKESELFPKGSSGVLPTTKGSTEVNGSANVSLLLDSMLILSRSCCTLKTWSEVEFSCWSSSAATRAGSSSLPASTNDGTRSDDSLLSNMSALRDLTDSIASWNSQLNVRLAWLSSPRADSFSSILGGKTGGRVPSESKLFHPADWIPSMFLGGGGGGELNASIVGGRLATGSCLFGTAGGISASKIKTLWGDSAQYGIWKFGCRGGTGGGANATTLVPYPGGSGGGGASGDGKLCRLKLPTLGDSFMTSEKLAAVGTGHGRTAVSFSEVNRSLQNPESKFEQSADTFWKLEILWSWSDSFADASNSELVSLLTDFVDSRSDVDMSGCHADDLLASFSVDRLKNGSSANGSDFLDETKSSVGGFEDAGLRSNTAQFSQLAESDNCFSESVDVVDRSSLVDGGGVRTAGTLCCVCSGGWCKWCDRASGDILSGMLCCLWLEEPPYNDKFIK